MCALCALPVYVNSCDQPIKLHAALHVHILHCSATKYRQNTHNPCCTEYYHFVSRPLFEAAAVAASTMLANMPPGFAASALGGPFSFNTPFDNTSS